MNYAQVREVLQPLVIALKDGCTHTMLPTLCEQLGLPAPSLEAAADILEGLAA